MGKLLKIILSIAGVLVGLLLVAIIVLPMVIDPNDYKDEIRATVEDRTGRTLEMEGDIALSVFPWLGVEIGPTRLGNAAGFSAPHMASMQAVEVRVKLLPLLRRELEVDTLRLDGLELSLEKDAAGMTNWDDLVAAGEAGAQDGGDETPSDGGGLEDLAIGGIEVTDARLVWDDRSAGARYEIGELAFTTGAIAVGESFDLDLGFTVAAKEPAIDGRFALTGGVQVADELKGVSIDAARIRFDATGDGVPGGRIELALGSDVALDLEAGTLSLPDVQLSAYNLDLRGVIAGEGIGGDDPRFNGSFTLAAFSPRELLEALGQAALETADSGALASADAALTWDASTKHFAVSKLQLHLDDTTADGTLRVDNFEAPAIGFSLDVDRINVDRYLPPPPAEGEASAAAEDEAPAELPLEALRKLKLNGTARVKEMTAINLRYRDAEVTVSADDGVVRLHPFGADMYDGSYRGDITLDARQRKPRLSVNERVSSVQAGPLLADLLDFDRLEGQADVTARFQATGITPEEIRRTISGNAAFSFTDGAVKGVNIASLIRNAQAKLKGQPAPPADLPNQTDFAVLKGTVDVTDGLARNDDLVLQSPLLRITGKGRTHLAEETIDYLLTTKLVGTLEGQGGRSLEELKGIAIPVRVGGTYSKPTWVPDLGAAMSEAAKAKVEEKVEQEKEKIKKKMGEKLGEDLLKGLFK